MPFAPEVAQSLLSHGGNDKHDPSLQTYVGSGVLDDKDAQGGRPTAYTGVRRLTPTECERLQALPDGWTLPGADSKRYAALGDAVTASVAQWIGERLAVTCRFERVRYARWLGCDSIDGSQFSWFRDRKLPAHLVSLRQTMMREAA